MTSRELADLVIELNWLVRPDRLRTDEEARADRKRGQTICQILGVSYPDDVFDRYGRYGEQINELGSLQLGE